MYKILFIDVPFRVVYLNLTWFRDTDLNHKKAKYIYDIIVEERSCGENIFQDTCTSISRQSARFQHL